MLEQFKLHLGGFPPSPELAKGFLAQYANRKPRTLYRYAQMIRVFMRWYGEEMADLKIKIPRTLPRYTQDDEVERLFEAIENKKTHKGTIVRDSLLVALALKSGMRRSELANLEAKDIHGDFLIVRGGKGGKDRVIPLGASIAQRLRNFTAKMEPEEKVFKLKAPCISNKIRQFAKKAGLEDFHAHTLRHKYATDLLERGANVKIVQELLGHENLATTEVYLSITDRSLREAVNLLDRNVMKSQFEQSAEGDNPTPPPSIRKNKKLEIGEMIEEAINSLKGQSSSERFIMLPTKKSRIGEEIDKVFGPRIR